MAKKSSANKHYQVLQKIMPHLCRQGADAKFGNKTWLWHELENQSKTTEADIRAAISDFQKRSNASFELSTAQIKFLGPSDVNVTKTYLKAARVPSTELAKEFRKHGVYLTRELFSWTTWMQRTHRNITCGREELVLTLHKGLIKRDADGVVRYSNLEVEDDSWEKRYSHAERGRALSSIQRVADGQFRVIRVVSRELRSGRFRITKASADGNYWRLESLKENGRFSAYRTSEKVVQYDLSITKLGVPDAIRPFR